MNLGSRGGAGSGGSGGSVDAAGPVGPACSLRAATVEDLAAIMAIERDVFPLDAWPEHLMRSELEAAVSHYLVAVDEAAADGSIAGYAGLRVVGDQGDIQTIAVATAMRRQGIARAMLTRLLAEAHRRRARDVFLEVRADNPGAIELYESLGFEHLAVRARYYPAATPADPPVDALVMRLTGRLLGRVAAEGRDHPRPAVAAMLRRRGSRQGRTDGHSDGR